MGQNIKPNNPLAFPTLVYSSHTGEVNGHQEGMTLRDHFAGLAMQALIVNSGKWNFTSNSDMPNITSFDSYRVADAMLKSRENVQ